MRSGFGDLVDVRWLREVRHARRSLLAELLCYLLYGVGVAGYEEYTGTLGDQLLREIYEDARTALTGRIFESLGEYCLEDTPAVRLLTNGWAAMVEEAVIAWVPDQQLPKDELLSLLERFVAMGVVSGRQPR